MYISQSRQLSPKSENVDLISNIESSALCSEVVGKVATHACYSTRPKNKNIESRDVIKTSISCGTDSVDCNLKKTFDLDLFLAWPRVPILSATFLEENELILMDFKDNIQNYMKIYLANVVAVDELNKVKIPKIIEIILSHMVLRSNLPKDAIRSILVNPYEYMDPILPTANQKKELIRHKTGYAYKKLGKTTINHIKKDIINSLASSHFDKYIYHMGNDDITSARESLSKLTGFVHRHKDELFNISKCQLELHSFYIEHALGNFDLAIEHLNKSASYEYPQAIWYRAMISLGLNNNYDRYVDPISAIKDLHMLPDKLKECIPDNNIKSVRLITADLIKTTNFIWKVFMSKTIRCEDFPLARDALFNMIGSIVPKVVDLENMSGMAVFEDGSILDKPLIKEILRVSLPPSEASKRLWRDIDKVIMRRQTTDNNINIDEGVIAELCDIFSDAGVSEEVILKFKDSNGTDLPYLYLIVTSEVEFITSYIVWVNAVNKKMEENDKTHKDEIYNTFCIMKDISVGDIVSKTDKSPAWLAKPPEWLCGTASSKEWARQALVAFLGLVGTPDYEKASFYCYMSALTAVNGGDSHIHNPSISKSYESVVEDNSKDFGAMALVVKTDIASDDHCVIMRSVYFILAKKNDDAIEILQEFNRTNKSPNVEFLLGYVKETQLKLLEGDDFQEKQSEVIKHYKEASCHGLEKAKIIVSIFNKNKAYLHKLLKKSCKKQESSINDNDRSSDKNLLQKESQLASLEIDSSSSDDEVLGDSDSTCIEPITLQKHQLEKCMVLQKPDDVSEFKLINKKDKHAPPPNLSEPISKYHYATQYYDIDFCLADEAINEMKREILLSTRRHAVATKIQVKQYEVWYYYKMLQSTSSMHSLTQYQKNQYKKKFYKLLEEGLALFNISINVRDPIQSIAMIKSSDLKSRLAREDPNVTIQIGSLFSSWGHYCSDMHPQHQYHIVLYELVRWINPFKHKKYHNSVSLSNISIVDNLPILEVI